MSAEQENVPYCCYLTWGDGSEVGAPCGQDAEWEIVNPNDPTDRNITQSCTEHVGQLLTDAPVHFVYPIAR